MATISDIEGRVQDRLEEARGAGVFWSTQDEIRPAIVEGMNEAALITGEPQARMNAPTTLAAATTLFAVPTGNIAILRIELPSGGLALSKASLWDLDRQYPGWQNEAAGALPKYWFPYGLTKFGIYPQLLAPIDVTITGVALPVTMSRPYSGAETIPYQTEYLEGFEEYAAHVLRLKEGGIDFVASTRDYDRFLQRMTELARFGLDKDMLRFTRSVGAPARVTDTISS